MFAYILSNLAGLIRQMMVSNTFGTSQQLDAFYAAVTVPDFLFNLLAGGALASAFIPIFTDLLKQRTTKEAFSLASAVVSLILLFLGSGSILTTFFAPQVVSKVLFVFRPELDPLTRDLSIDLLWGQWDRDGDPEHPPEIPGTSFGASSKLAWLDPRHLVVRAVNGHLWPGLGLCFGGDIPLGYPIAGLGQLARF